MPSEYNDYYIVSTSTLISIADTIRTKGGTSAQLTYPDGFIDAIDNISGGDEPFPMIEDDGNTHIIVNVLNPNLDMILYFSSSVADGVTIDWGDNNTTNSIAGSQNYFHTYSTTGEYDITLTVNSGTLSFPTNITGTVTAGLPIRSWVKAIYIFSTCTINASNIFSTLYNLQVLYLGSNIALSSTSIYLSVSSDYNLKYFSVNFEYNSARSINYANCISLKNFYIPLNITTLESLSYTNISEITIPSTVTTLASSNFSNCRQLRSIIIPSLVTNIPSSCFSGCSKLLSVSMLGSVTALSTNAFYGCYSLSNINLPNTITTIGDSAFTSCHGLITITLPSNLTSLGNSVFNSCYNLTTITVPELVTSIGTSCFSNCTSVKEYHFLSTTPPTLASTNAFNNIQSNCKIYVPNSALSDYQTATNWSTYASYMVGE